MIINYFIYAVVGGVSIFFLRKFPITDKIVLKIFNGCNLCLGVWVYSALAFVFRMNILQEYFYMNILSELITGAVTSLLVHLVTIGWKSEFSTIVIGE